MPNKTPNYDLTKPTPSEFYDVGVQNDNMDKIDEALHAHDEALSEAGTALEGKVDKVSGKGLSTNDYSNAEKQKVADTATGLANAKGELNELEAYVGYTDDSVYGVEVDLQNKVFTRLAGAVGKTPGASFDGIAPWGGRRRCNVADDGTVTAYRGGAGYTETGKLTVATAGKAVGTPVQVMVEQPCFYYRVVPLKMDRNADGEGFHLRKARYYISPEPRAGFKLHPAFISDGHAKRKIYLSAYEGCLADGSNNYQTNDPTITDFNTYKFSSIAGAKPASGKGTNLTRGNSRKLCQNRGAGWQLQYCATASASQMLMLVEYAAFNMQTAIGNGAVSKTDDGSSNMAENTGATASLGNASGAVTNGNGIQIVSYRGEENLWGNIWKFIDGMNINAKGIHKLYVADHGFADDTITGVYQDTGITLAKATGYVSAFGYSEPFDWLFVPSEVLGSDALPVGDYFWQNFSYNGIMITILGALWDNGLRAGPFCWHVNHVSSVRYRSIGARPVYIPVN